VHANGPQRAQVHAALVLLLSAGRRLADRGQASHRALDAVEAVQVFGRDGGLERVLVLRRQDGDVSIEDVTKWLSFLRYDTLVMNRLELAKKRRARGHPYNRA